MRRRCSGDGGAALVEFAFVAPILFLFFTVLTDLGLVVLGTSVASNAARDGARVGIIHFDAADQTGSANRQLIEDAVEARLVGLIRPGTGVFVSIQCLDGSTKAVKDCDEDVVIDRDIVEVTVHWKALLPGGGLLVDEDHVDVARMVIVGDGSGTPGLPPPSSLTGGFTLASVTTGATETDGTSVVTLALTRSSGTGTVAITYATVNGSAVAGTDYTAASNILNFADGETSKTIDVTIIGDNDAESAESFTAVLLSPVGLTIESGRGTATVTISDDDTTADSQPPTLVALQMRDVDADGKVDQVVATFSESLDPTCASPSAFTLTSAPSGATLQGVAVSGMTAMLSLTEGASAHDTAVGAFRVALASGCIRDPAGNFAMFAQTAPTDLAAPILLAVTHTNGLIDGKFETGDTMTMSYSEPIFTAPASVSVIVDDTGSSDVLQAPGLLNVDVALGADYASKTLTFNPSLIAKTGNTLVIALGACSTNGSCASRALVGLSPSLVFTPSIGLKDAAGNSAAGSVTVINVRMF